MKSVVAREMGQDLKGPEFKKTRALPQDQSSAPSSYADNSQRL